MKKLIPAICMTLIAAFMLASSTFAWFSMNTTVTASGMTVTAKSDNPFLQIVKSTEDFLDNVAQATATAANGTKEVRPTAAVKTIETNALTPLSASDDASAIKWAEAYSKNPATSTIDKTEYKDVTTAAKATDSSNVYTLINDFKVRLNPTAGATTATNLKVSGVTITSTAEDAKDALLPAVRVLIVCGDNWAIWENGAHVASKGGQSILSATVTTEATAIKVYIFFDGEDEVTTTNNAATIKPDGYKVEFALSVN